ncbi:hypothetical protein OSB04_016874 [Centaurea solstitialis]|uniref:Vacuolar protein sorting-associated protein 26C n=1 Tax=Centaurea solstitialis TaxID=347529 RepID=A0AA38WK63_9ASTR|nr:hypothetical protein OSB04_016874 [Centaurea solstitialis]
MSIEIKLSRSNRTYRPDEPIQGNIITKLPSSISHRGIQLTVNGSANLQVRGGSAGLIESLYGVLKPIPIVKKSIEVQPSGKISAGTTQIPFSMILKNQGEEHKFYETFHGANISIQYLLNVDLVRGYLHKSLSATVEFIIESDLGTELLFLYHHFFKCNELPFLPVFLLSTASLPEKPVSPEMVFFYITQDTQRHALLTELISGGFKISGRICTQCLLSDPLVGELTVEASAVPIYSIDIHLLRIESIMVGERIATETSVIQTTQARSFFILKNLPYIADGDVCRAMSLPIYVVLPRLLTCPTVFAGPFSIEFKVTIVVTFQTDLYYVQPKSDPRALRKWVAMESLPLELVQSN